MIAVDKPDCGAGYCRPWNCIPQEGTVKDVSIMPPLDNAFAGIVLTAQTFNPSIFTETWLVQHGLLPADAFVGTRVFSPEVAQFQMQGLQVMVVPPMMQIIFGILGDEEMSIAARRFAARTIELLPHTPFQALGLNFDYFVRKPDEGDFGQFNRALLGNGNNGLLSQFSEPNSRFGRYFSKDHGEARIRLDVKPVQAGPDKKELLQFSFNFHHDVSALTGNRASKLGQLLEHWESARDYANELVRLGTAVDNEVFSK
jgi:hypothetical protein